MKKVISIVLSLCLLLSIVNLAVADETPTFNIFAGVTSMSPDNSTKPLVAQLNKAAGVNINWECVSSADLTALTERKNLLFASNDLPDAFMAANLTDYEIMTYGGDGALIPLNDYLVPEIMPNLCKVLDARPEIKSILTMPDGNIYTLPTVGEMGFVGSDGKNYQIDTIPQFTIINTEWLTKLGLKMPTTMDELHDVLVAFRDDDPNGNGKKDEIPLSFIFDNWTAGMTTFFAGFGLTDYNDPQGVAYHRGLVDGKVVYNGIRDEYKNAIAYLSKWYQEGLIDVEVFSQDPAKYISKGKNDEMILGSYVWWEIPEVVGTDRASSYALMPPLTGPDGKLTVNLRDTTSVTRSDFAITNVCKDPVTLLKWVDQLYDPIIGMQASYGPIGDFFEAEPDANGVYVNKKPAEGTTEGEMKEVMRLNAPIATLSDYYGKYFYMEPRAQERLDILRDFWFPYVKDTSSYPSVTYTKEETEELNDLYSNIVNYTSEKTATWMTNGNIDGEWDDYVAQLKSLGVDRIVEIWQSAYDRYQSAMK